MNEQIITLTEENLGEYRAFCGLSGRYLKGHHKKNEWLKARFREGLRYKIYQVDGKNAGFIEYVPGEYAWRGVDANGYLFIHCFWVLGRHKKHGYGRQLLDICLQDAQTYHGVAVVASKTHWLPTPKIFLKNGFELVDQAPPSFDLLVKRFSPNAPMPRFNQNWRGDYKFSRSLTFIKSDQCPYMYVMDDGLLQIGDELNIPVNIVRLETAQEAQSSPCVYGVMGLFYNGELLTYHPMGKEKILELLKPKLKG
jgi:GNAT superfamily N-acetyltransferase